MPEPLDFLRRAALFRDCTEEQLAAIHTAATFRAIEEDGYYFQQGDPADRLFILTEGRSRLTQVTADGLPDRGRVAQSGDLLRHPDRWQRSLSPSFPFPSPHGEGFRIKLIQASLRLRKEARRHPGHTEGIGFSSTGQRRSKK